MVITNRCEDQIGPGNHRLDGRRGQFLCLSAYTPPRTTQNTGAEIEDKQLASTGELPEQL